MRGESEEDEWRKRVKANVGKEREQTCYRESCEGGEEKSKCVLSVFHIRSICGQRWLAVSSALHSASSPLRSPTSTTTAAAACGRIAGEGGVRPPLLHGLPLSAHCEDAPEGGAVVTTSCEPLALPASFSARLHEVCTDDEWCCEATLLASPFCAKLGDSETVLAALASSKKVGRTGDGKRCVAICVS